MERQKDVDAQIEDIAAELRPRDGWPRREEDQLDGGVPVHDDYAACQITRKEDWIELYANGCKAMILHNQRISSWPGVARPPTSQARRLSLPQDVGARDKPGQGAFGSKIRCKTLVQTALEFSPDRAGVRGLRTSLLRGGAHPDVAQDLGVCRGTTVWIAPTTLRSPGERVGCRLYNILAHRWDNIGLEGRGTRVT
jgi:hypothetical protein